MSFTEAIGSGFRRYVDFSGRSSRSEYWWWTLFVFIGSVVFSVLDALIGTSSVLNLLFSLAVFLPGLAVSVRRLHDVDRSGWWYLIIFTIIGIIVLLVWYVRRGDDVENRFGANPLHASTDPPYRRPVFGESGSSVRYCSTCGAENSTGSRYCASCGAAMG